MSIPSPKKSKKLIAFIIGMSAVVVVSLYLLSEILTTFPASDNIDVFVTPVDLTFVYNGKTVYYKNIASICVKWFSLENLYAEPLVL